jgi:Ni/Co efflux regulator RcnB
MKRWIIAALAALAALATLGVQAHAQERGPEGGHERDHERGRDGFGRGGYERAAPPRDGRYAAPGYGRGRDEYAPPYAAGRYPGGYPDERGYPGPRGPYAPPPAYAPPYLPHGHPGGAGVFRRGQFLPQAYWGGLLADPRVYRLRRPPAGYGWVTVGPNAYLMQRSTGLILDTAPLY